MPRKKSIKKEVADDLKEEKKEYKVAEVYVWSRFYNIEEKTWQDVHDASGERVPELKRIYTSEQNDPELNDKGVKFEDIKGGGERRFFVEKADGYAKDLGGFVKKF